MTQISHPTLNRWYSLVQSRGLRISGAGLMVFSGLLTLVTLGEVWTLARALPPAPPEVAQDLVVKNVPDLAGRRASFRILLFTDEFRWRLNSFKMVENADAPPLFTPEMKAVLNSAEEVIAVGASSEETPVGFSFDEGRAMEEWRAARRADQIATWVRQALSKPIPVRKLNVGHHAPTGQARDTSDQRRVVIILVLDRDEAANIDEALRSAMSSERHRAPIFETLLTKYSLSSGEAFAWIP